MPPLVPLLVATSSVSISDVDLNARLQFLEEHLEAPKLHARVYWWGWLSFYAAVIGVQSVRLALVDDDHSNPGAARADYVIGMVKTSLGIASLLIKPLHAMEGASEMHAIEGDDRSAKLKRLRAGEAALRQNAEESELRHWLLRHLAILALNLAHGLIVWIGYDDPERGMISAGLGFVFGEIIAWTQPWQPQDSFRTYQTLFPGEVYSPK